MSNCDCDLPDGRKQTRRGTLARAVEQREVKRREQEAVRQEMEKFFIQQKAYDTLAGNQFKDDVKRVEREAKERSQEASLINSLYQAEKTKELALIRAEEEERLATALVRRVHEKERRDKEVQHLREQSAELRELAEKIRAARVNKERSLQLQEKAQIQAQQAEYDAAFNQFVQESSAAAAAKEAAAQERRREQAVQARHVLEEQMQERKDALRLAEAEALRERAMVDEIVKRIRDEDMADAALRRQKQEETKAYIASFLEQQARARAAKQAADAAEERKIQEYWEMVRGREAEEAARKAAQKEVADRLYEQVKREMEAAQRAREEEEDLINLLRAEEAEAKRRAEEEERIRKAEEQRREIQRANEYQMRLKEEREAARKAEEEAFRRAMMAKFAEDDRLEQLNQQKRRLKQAEHAREVQRMVDERRRMYEEQKAREEAELAAAAAEDARRKAILEEERRALLAEAADLLEYLPRGVLRDQADLAYVQQVAAKNAAAGRTNPFLTAGASANYH